MKTISGKPVSEKPISLSKASKILSKFISAENGASHVINAYLHRASSSFSELNQLHKELKLPRSDRKHKRSRSKSCNDSEKIEENYIQSVENNEEPNHWAVHHFGNKNPSNDAEKPSQTTVKVSHESDVTSKYDARTEGSGSLKKKKKHSVKLKELGVQEVKFEEVEADHKTQIEAGNEMEEKEPAEREKRKKKKKHGDDYSKQVVDDVIFEKGLNNGNVDDDKEGLEEGKKHKKEKMKKKDADIMINFYDKLGEVTKSEEDAKASRKDGGEKEIVSNGFENRNGDPVVPKELPNKKKKRHMAESKDKIDTDEGKQVHKKRKNEDVEGRDYDKSGEPTKKKIKRKHGGED